MIFTIILFLILMVVSLTDLLTAVMCFIKNKEYFFNHELNTSLSWYLDNFSISKSIFKVSINNLLITLVFIVVVYFSGDIFGIERIVGLNLFLFAYILCSFVGVFTNVYAYIIMENKK